MGSQFETGAEEASFAAISATTTLTIKERDHSLHDLVFDETMTLFPRLVYLHRYTQVLRVKGRCWVLGFSYY